MIFEMKKSFLNSWGYVGLAATALGLNACAPNQDTPTPTIGINVSRYVAVGDTYTGGLSAGGLTLNSQQYAYPNLIALQMRGAAGDVAFTQPLMEPGTGSGYLSFIDLNVLGFPRSRRVAGAAVQRTIINPTACGGADTIRVLARSAISATLPQNLGVPGLRLTQIETANLGNQTTATPGTPFNPYFERLLPATDSRTYLQAVTTAASTATFFTFFQGLDDLMPYVRSGGDCGQLEISTSRNALLNTMRTNAKKILDQLAANGRPGIIARLPDLASLPYLRLGKGNELQTRLQTRLRDTAQVYIQDPLGFGPAQRISENDYVLATALNKIGQLMPVVVGGTTMMLPYGRDSRNPLRDSDVMDSRELSFANTVVNSYNTELDRLAKDVYRLPPVTPSINQSTLDLSSALFNFLPTGISIEGVVYTTEPVRGNVFSVDYYSLTPRGNGMLANAFITAINKAYKANLPAVNVNTLPTTAQP